MQYRINKKDFKLFQQEVHKWLERFGLKGWNVYFEHINIPGSLAQTQFNIIERLAIFKLSTTWDIPPTPEEIKKTAFHEVCELLLSRIRIIAKSRFINEDEIDEEIHNIIRILENTIFPKN